MTQTFVDGKRVPVTVLELPTLTVTQIKTDATDGYSAAQIAIGEKNKAPKKSLLAHLAKSKITKQPRWMREISLPQDSTLAVGDVLNPSDFLTAGDTITATSTSIGKGFAGVMKRYNFAGGPRTHGQSDRARATGSIGRGTTPGRVLPGKKMPGHMGDELVAVKNLKIISIDSEKNQLLVAGPVPGSRNKLVKITVTKKNNQNQE